MGRMGLGLDKLAGRLFSINRPFGFKVSGLVLPLLSLEGANHDHKWNFFKRGQINTYELADKYNDPE